ncbi:MAG: WhiB family transcriptional regulator [Pseudonocardiales bacterium]|nr:WhiB family transcriptional regulator [Pseudonocardiales bacterium]
MTDRWNWRPAARCRTADAEELFVTGARQREAREVCRTCPVRTECLAHALDQRIEFGVWGGMTERQRRALLRARPDVGSWHDLLVDARRAYYAADPDDVDALAERAVARRTADELERSA